MKILILNTSFRIGGAAVAASRLMRALQRNDVEVSMLVLNGTEVINGVFSVNDTWWKRKISLFRFYWERLIIFLYNHFNRSDLFRVSIANTGNDISNHPLVKEADIIHLHWINQGFLSLNGLHKLFQLGKPIVWTMHDMWPCTGICHHSRECDNYTNKCGKCFYLQSSNERDLSTSIFLKKKDVYQSANITFVGCSKWLANRANQSLLLHDKQVLDIPNPLDLSIFKKLDRSGCRKKLNLPLDKHLILFGALNVTDSRKGVDYLFKALSLLKGKNIELVVFGQVKKEIKDLLSVPIHSMGYLSDENQIAELYNAVDMFVTSSLEENLPNTIMEAMACGTSCVGFNIGGIPEMIDHLQNGYVAEYMNAEDLATGILWVLDNTDKKSLSDSCIKKVEETYAENIIADRYKKLYQQLIENNRKR